MAKYKLVRSIHCEGCEQPQFHLQNDAGAKLLVVPRVGPGCTPERDRVVALKAFFGPDIEATEAEEAMAAAAQGDRP